jgi:hypothetical protein
VNDSLEQGAEPVPQDLNSDVTFIAESPSARSIRSANRQLKYMAAEIRTDEHAGNERPSPLRAFGPVRPHRNRDGN